MAVLVALACPAHASAREGCQSKACVRRVQDRTWRIVVRPHSAWLARVRACESGGRYRLNTGNGFYGAYEFSLGSWRAVGGRGLPHLARPLEQDYRAVRLLRLQGRSAWPICG